MLSGINLSRICDTKDQMDGTTFILMTPFLGDRVRTVLTDFTPSPLAAGQLASSDEGHRTTKNDAKMITVYTAFWRRSVFFHE